jgi:hypothetical protein
MMHESVGHFWEHGIYAFVSGLQNRTGMEASLECMSITQDEKYQEDAVTPKFPSS